MIETLYKYRHVFYCTIFSLPVLFNFLLFLFSARKKDKGKGEHKQNVNTVDEHDLKPVSTEKTPDDSESDNPPNSNVTHIEEPDLTKVSTEVKKNGDSESDNPPNSQTEIKQNSPTRAKTRIDPSIIRPRPLRIYQRIHETPHYQHLNNLVQ